MIVYDQQVKISYRISNRRADCPCRAKFIKNSLNGYFSGFSIRKKLLDHTFE